jgi:hypothetical protein
MVVLGVETEKLRRCECHHNAGQIPNRHIKLADKSIENVAKFNHLKRYIKNILKITKKLRVDKIRGILHNI